MSPADGTVYLRDASHRPSMLDAHHAMKSGGTRALAGPATVAAKTAWLPWIGIAMLVAGLLIVAGSVTLLVWSLRQVRGRTS